MPVVYPQRGSNPTDWKGQVKYVSKDLLSTQVQLTQAMHAASRIIYRQVLHFI